jgi:hypothetical protein
MPTLAHYQDGVSAFEAHPAIQRLAGNDEAVRGQAQARLYQAPVSLLLADPLLQHEVFGPLAVLVEVADEAEMQAVLRAIQGQLTATVHAESDDGPLAQRLLPALSEKAGRVLFNGIRPAWKCAMRWCTAARGLPPPIHAGPPSEQKPSNVFCVRCACKMCPPHCCRLLPGC